MHHDSSHVRAVLAEAIVHANSYRESSEEARRTLDAPALTIAVSRQAGAGGTSIAAEVGGRLNWPVYDHALLERIAQEMHLRTRLLDSVDERRTHWLVESVESFSQVPLVNENAFVRHLIQTILSLGTHGACIIVGRVPRSSCRRHRRCASCWWALATTASPRWPASWACRATRPTAGSTPSTASASPSSATISSAIPAIRSITISSSIRRASPTMNAQLIIEALNRREARVRAGSPALAR